MSNNTLPPVFFVQRRTSEKVVLDIVFTRDSLFDFEFASRLGELHG